MTTITVPKYKITLAPPTDTDPPTNPIWTVDELTGINPPFSVIKDMASPYDYGAVGDGVADDTTAMQAWLDAIANGAGYGATGTFKVSNTLLISARTTIYGAGKGNCVIGKLDSFPSSAYLMLNKNLSFTPNAPVDSNIAIYGVCFQGLGSQVTATQLTGFVGVNGLIIRDCLFMHHRYGLLAGSNCQNVVVDSSEFYDWGAVGPTTHEDGECIWFGSADYHIRITNNYIHDGQWSGMLISATGVIIANNRIHNTRECGIFSNVNTAFMTIVGNSISGVTRKDISSHGMELGGSNVVVTGNTIDSTEGESIHFTDPVIVTIANNICNSPAQDPVYYAGASCIGINSYDPALGATNLIITGNNCSARDGKAAAGIYLANSRFGIVDAPIRNVTINNNNVAPASQWRTAPIVIGEGVTGNFALPPDDPNYLTSNEFLRRGNLGSPDEDRSAVEFIIPSGSSGTKIISGVGFKPRAIDFQAVLPSASGQLGASVGQCMWLTGYTIGTGVTSPRANMNSNCQTWATDGTDCYSANFSGSYCLMIQDPTLADTTGIICAAGVIEISDDGFSLTVHGPETSPGSHVFSPTTANVIVTAICYP